jgi:transcriptional regulator with XRE-family HTH domain
MNYGKAIKIVRTAHSLSQNELAERLSIGASQLSLIEAGKRQPSLKVLDEISKALGVPPHLLTLLASGPSEIDRKADPKQIAELARSLLELLVSSGEQPTLPMKTETKAKRLKRAG